MTLVGPGGSGKTRLALHRGRARSTAGAAVALVELAGVGAEDVAGQIAASLGIALSGAGSPGGAPPDGGVLATVAAAVRGRRVLLLLDNCEHLLDAAAQAAATLLGAAEDLVVLATSREPLGVPGEAVLPSARCRPPATTATRCACSSTGPACRLRRSPSPAAADRALVQRICAELDGLPLAVELAAACLVTLPLAEVAERVDDRFTLLAGGWRSAPPHQRTLAATVQWSVDLLTPVERSVFCALSVFSGSFAEDAVQAVLGPDVPASGPLRALVAKSLVELDRATGRYRLLETLRQFADAACSTTGPGAGWATGTPPSSSRWWSASSRRCAGTTGGPAGSAWTSSSRDLRAALTHALARGRPDLALRLCACLTWWWFRRGHAQEGRRWLEQALPAAPDAAPARPGPRHVRAGHARVPAGRRRHGRDAAPTAVVELAAGPRRRPARPRPRPARLRAQPARRGGLPRTGGRRGRSAASRSRRAAASTGCRPRSP